MKLKNIIKTGMIGSLALLMAACSNDDQSWSGSEPDGTEDSSEVSITLSIQPSPTPTRGYLATGNHISSGALVDELIYAIYASEEGKGEFQRVDFYQANYSTSKAGQGQNFNDIEIKPVTIPAGQTYVGFKTGDTYTLTFKVDKNKDYRIVCWAQSSKCEAYNTRELTSIEVDYTGATNNDEYRDVFSAFKEFKGGVKNQVINVVLTRPVAQINIGTSGADYKNLIYDKMLMPSKVTITESKITVRGVANRFNALNGIATVENAANTSLKAEFDWNTLPAWIHMDVPEFKDEYTIKNNPFVPVGQTEETAEEFLTVKLNTKDNNYAPFVTEYPTLTKNADGSETYNTETFKYLSMCYVMVPGSLNSGSIVTVDYNLQQKKGEQDTRPIELTERTLTQVPVQGNYRTNIIGGVAAIEENEDGGTDEPDPSSIFNYYQLQIILDKNFSGNNLVRYFTASLYVNRPYYDEDGLTIIKKTQEEEVEEELEDAENLKIPSIFIDLSITYTFTVSEGFKVLRITSNVEEKEGKWKQEGEGRSRILTIYSGATAGTFNITIAKDTEE